MNDDTTLAVVQETEILGKKIKVYNSIESPLFLASDVAEWIEHSQTSKMVKSVEDDEKLWEHYSCQVKTEMHGF